MPTPTEYTYTKASINSEALTSEIQLSSISVALQSIDFTQPNSLSVWFKDSLPGADETTLDALIISHTGDPSETSATQVVDSFIGPNDYSQIKYKAVAAETVDTDGGTVIPSGQKVGVYRYGLNGSNSPDAYVALVFDYNGGGEKYFGCTSGDMDRIVDPAKPIWQVTGDGVAKLQVIIVNDLVTVSPVVGGFFEASNVE